MEEIVKKYFTEELGEGDVVAEILYNKVSKYEDIYAEFLYWLKNRTFVKENPVTIDGYTAQNVFEGFDDLLEIGAFGALVSLRTNHDEMLAYMKAGMPVD